MDLLTMAIIAFVISIIAGAMGFSGVARGTATAARVFFGIFLLIAIILVVMVLLGLGVAL